MATSVIADTSYVAIDRFVSLDSTTGVIGETVLLLGHVNQAGSVVRLLTLSTADGGPLGVPAITELPAGSCFPELPNQLLYSRYVQPRHVIALDAQQKMALLPIFVTSNGSVWTGQWSCAGSAVDTAEAGKATAIAEMPGSSFTDGIPRLIVGTSKGQLMVYVPGQSGMLEFEQVVDLAPGQKINDLAPFPLYWGISMGVAVGDEIRGYMGIGPSPVQIFSRQNPSGRDIKSFRVFWSVEDEVASSSEQIDIAYCDGTASQVYYASVAATTFGTGALDSLTGLQPRMTPSGTAKSGTHSLLILKASGFEVLFRLGYGSQSGAAGCAVDVTNESSQVCAVCPVSLTGDIDGSEVVNSGDLIRMVNYIFKSGQEPDGCVAVADVNCSGSVNATDLIRLINFTFKAGDPPCNVCTIFNGTWSCP
jgi:hypothetical protein